MTDRVGVRTQVHRKIAEHRAHRDYLRKREEAATAGGRLCGVYHEDGRPEYFVMPADASDEDIQNRAFEIRHGRPIGAAELTLLRMAKQRGLLEREQ